MIFYYLDASAWIKRHYQETGTTWVQELFARNQAIACASLGLIEVIATLARKHKAREIDLALFEHKVWECALRPRCEPRALPKPRIGMHGSGRW